MRQITRFFLSFVLIQTFLTPATCLARTYDKVIQGKPAMSVPEMMQSTVQIKVTITGKRTSNEKTLDDILMGIDPKEPVSTGWLGSGVVYEKTMGLTAPIKSHILSANHVVNIPREGDILDDLGPQIEVLSVKMEAITYDGRTCNLKPLTVGNMDTDDVGTAEADCDAGRAVPIAKAIPAMGSPVFLSGHPLGFPQTIVTTGFTSGWFNGYLGMSVPAAPGNSGGPVFYNGEVIGVLVRGSSVYSFITLSVPLDNIINHVHRTHF